MLTNLFETLDNVSKNFPAIYKELPLYIKSNLKYENLRDYQIDAFKHYITYFENKNMKTSPSQVLFHMATGSGKTLIMAGLILYLYKQGYRDFIFFVSSSNIIKKTKANFIDKTSSKYLFKENISIDGKNVAIKEVIDFKLCSKEDINIIFETTQKLHSDMNTIHENAISIEDFRERKVVFIADEAHHLNSYTKSKKNTEEESGIKSWETTVKRVFKSNAENVLLEFTATLDLQNPEINKEYKDKIIFNYDLKKFSQDGFSKEIQSVRTDMNSIMDRVLLALLFSQYRLKLFQEYNLNIKPCVLLKGLYDRKTDKGISLKEHIENFNSMIQSLTGDKIQQLLKPYIQKNDPKIIQIVNYFKKRNISYTALSNEIKNDFSQEHIISANDDTELEKNQLALNSLEDLNNPYRAIFEVKKLDEGWDVLNLFDIVRLYESRQSGGKVSPTTTSEAQLIGRGARYYPFKLNDDDNPYIRKYDSDDNNEMRICETLLYHCQNDSRYINEIHTALTDLGLKIDNTEKVTYKLKDTFKNENIFKYGKVLVNDRKEINRKSVDELLPSFRDNAFFEYRLNSGILQTDKILNDVQNITTNKTINTNSITLSIKDIVSKNYYIVRKALCKFEVLKFSNLIKYYPNLKSIKQFITDDKYMNSMKINVFSSYTNFDEFSVNELYQIAVYISSKISDHILGINKTYKGTYTFIKKDISKVFTDKTITLKEIKINGIGSSQKIDSNYALDLSNKEWFVYEDNYGTSEEKAFVYYLNSKINDLQKEYDKIYLIRNERQLHLYSFDEGLRFEPDYVLFLIKKKNIKKQMNFIQNNIFDTDYDQLQVFIEPKGSHLINNDIWKEKFLLQLKELNLRKTVVDNKVINGDGVWGLHFYNTESRQSDFIKDIDELIK